MLIRRYSTTIRTARVGSGINVTLKYKFRSDTFLYTRQYSTFEITDLTIYIIQFMKYKTITDNVMCECVCMGFVMCWCVYVWVL